MCSTPTPCTMRKSNMCRVCMVYVSSFYNFSDRKTMVAKIKNSGKEIAKYKHFAYLVILCNLKWQTGAASLALAIRSWRWYFRNWRNSWMRRMRICTPTSSRSARARRFRSHSLSCSPRWSWPPWSMHFTMRIRGRMSCRGRIRRNSSSCSSPCSSRAARPWWPRYWLVL